MGFFSRTGQILLGAALVGAAIPSCYSAGAGTSPPPNTFYFPVGLAVSESGKVLYVVNSDFDLQWNGGTLQSYDLQAIRDAATNLILANLTSMPTPPACPGSPPPGGTLLGQRCAPPRPSQTYFEQSVTIGAFATSLQFSSVVAKDGTQRTQRLFMPVRGDATVTWADVNPDNASQIDCGQGSSGRCGASHQAGNDPNQLGNTRQVTLPGEPFGIAQTEDGKFLAVTSQTTTQTSLLTTGFPPLPPPADSTDPTMQFVLGGMPNGGVGIAAVPHDPDAPAPGSAGPPTTMSLATCGDPTLTPPCPSSRCEDLGLEGRQLPSCVRPAFLETSRSTAEIDLLRLYDDNGSSQYRPFLSREAAFPITSNAVGTDSRGIVIDATPRILCKSKCSPGDQSCRTACGQLAARVFFASRTPPALGLGEIGGPPPNGIGGYDPDRLVLTGNVPLPAGPSNVYLAPIIDSSGRFAPRVFIVCFDSNQIVVYDPDAGAVEKVINVGAGPFAMAFDPFSMWSVGRRDKPADQPPPPGSQPPPGSDRPPPPPYRFAYLANFTQSYVQMIDLDNSQPTAETFENIVFTLGQPTLPKGQ